MAAGMPDIWHSYTCAPCRATIAIGGGWLSVTCPYCTRLMERLAEHRPGGGAA